MVTVGAAPEGEGVETRGGAREGVVPAREGVAPAREGGVQGSLKRKLFTESAGGPRILD